MSSTPNHSLNPGQIAASDGGFFGHIEVYNKGEDVTESCSVLFSDESGDAKRLVSLKESEWVFITIKAGPTYISRIGCALALHRSQARLEEARRHPLFV